MIQRRLLLLSCAVFATASPLACGPRPPQTTRCSADLLPGDLVISEIMANPDGTDAGNEWFEVYNALGENVDITGLRLISSRADLTGEKVHAVSSGTIAPGQYYVFGEDSENGPPFIDYGYGAGLGSLRNSDGRIALECNDVIVDEVVYGNTSDGKSLSLTGAIAPDYQANDDPASWCNSSENEFAAGNFGTPGAANEVCPGGPNPTTCDEGGMQRDLRPPTPGTLVITEVMPNPAAVNDSAGEWFELLATAAVDLNGLEVGTEVGTPRTTLSDSHCLSMAAGDRIVFARSLDEGANGGVSADFQLPFGLTNSNGSLFVAHEGLLLDAVSWTSAPSGASLQVDPGAEDPTANDDSQNWCEGTEPYGAGDLGSPGEPNSACPIRPNPGECLEGGAPRAVVAPAAGDLHIVEWMPNPAAVGDSDGEWFEVQVSRRIDLNGLELGRTPGAVDAVVGDPMGRCLTVDAGTYLVFARSTDSAVNGGLPQVDAVFGFSLVNSDGSLFIGYDGQVLDQVTWASSTAGAATQIDGQGKTCAATTPYGQGDLGTPGAANPDCP
ncbi:MAG: hypothetical protein D6729_08985 [Deltaproteobacteria bacterium]|nr:MAG: hypothetical protein D6729_08985 [Deltaproteobacteria bacterium]